MDIYYLADKRPFKDENDGFFKFMIGLKIFSDIISLIGVIIAFASVCSDNYTYAIIAYYVMVLCFFINLIFGVYTIIGIFKHFDLIGVFFIPWFILDFGLCIFCWILFANQVSIGRQRRKQATQTSY